MIKPTREELLDFSTLDDDMLFHLIAARQVKGLEALFDRYAARLYSFIRSKGMEAEQATQLTEAVFLKIWTIKEEQIPAPEHFVAWFEEQLRDCTLQMFDQEGQSITGLELSSQSTFTDIIPLSVIEHLLEQAYASKGERVGGSTAS